MSKENVNLTKKNSSHSAEWVYKLEVQYTIYNIDLRLSLQTTKKDNQFVQKRVMPKVTKKG